MYNRPKVETTQYTCMGELLASDSYVTMYVYSVAENHSSNGVYGKCYFMCMYMLKPQFSK